jgi:hypothetical protein
MSCKPARQEDENARLPHRRDAGHVTLASRAAEKLTMMKVGVFLHGTAIMHAAAAGVERDERVQQVRRREPSVRDFASYLPTPGTAEKLAAWQRHGGNHHLPQLPPPPG